MNIFNIIFNQPNHGLIHFSRDDNKPFGITDQLDWETEEIALTAYNSETDDEWYIVEDSTQFSNNKLKFRVYNMADYSIEETWEGELFINSILIDEYKANLIMLGVPITNLPTP